MERLFVGGIPFQSTQSDLETFLSKFGKVEKVELHADWINPTFEPYAIAFCKKEHKNSVLQADNKRMGTWPLKVNEVLHG